MKRHVLFVCVRNRVRSVFAEFYLRKHLDEKMGQIAGFITISSAGLYPKAFKKLLDKASIRQPDPFFDTDMSAIARERMRAKDIGVADPWRSKLLTQEMVLAADVVVTALPWQKEEIEEMRTGFRDKMFTFKELAAWEENVLFETLSGLPLDESFWDSCEEDKGYVTKVVNEVEDLMDIGFPKMLSQLGIINSTV